MLALSLVEIGNWVDADQSTGRILHIPAGKVFQETVADVGVTLTIRYLTEPRRRRSAENAIWEGILDAFWRADDIVRASPGLFAPATRRDT